MFQGKIINDGQSDLIIGKDIEVWEGDGIIPFIFADTLQTGYGDINTIELINKYGDYADNDYKFVRDRLKDIVIQTGLNNLQSDPHNLPTDPTTLTPQIDQAWEIGEGAVGDWAGMDEMVAVWDGSVWVFLVGDAYAGSVEEYGFTFLNANEQKICAAKLIGTVVQQLISFGVNIFNPPSTPIALSEKSKAQGIYKHEVQRCRADRYEFIKNDVLQNIPQLAVEFLNEMGQLPSYYQEYGVDGYPIDEFVGDKTDPVDILENTGIASYILGKAAFEGAGLINKTFTAFNEMNPTQYANYLADKLFNGGLNGADREFIGNQSY